MLRLIVAATVLAGSVLVGALDGDLGGAGGFFQPYAAQLNFGLGLQDRFYDMSRNANGIHNNATAFRRWINTIHRMT